MCNEKVRSQLSSTSGRNELIVNWLQKPTKIQMNSSRMSPSCTNRHHRAEIMSNKNFNNSTHQHDKIINLPKLISSSNAYVAGERAATKKS